MTIGSEASQNIDIRRLCVKMAYVSSIYEDSLTKSLNPQKPIHLIGIGGIGMSALALILVSKGHKVSGSDPKKSKTLKTLAGKGAKIFQRQAGENINSIISSNEISPLVVISSAIPENNPELQAATRAGLEIWHRSDLLALLIKKQPSIAVAGSHGKTTTSSILTTLLAIAEHDPSAIIGGVIPHYKSNGHFGRGRLLIAEADESDGTLVKFEPELGLITNLELDHTDHFSDLDELIKSMQLFGKKCKKLLANYDCPILRNNFHDCHWWSIRNHQEANFAALPINFDGKQTTADIYENSQKIGQIEIPLPGLHNLSNCIAAIGACRLEGLTFNEIQQGITYLKAPLRRFDFRGNWQGRLIVDDYGHHPSEVKATLSMAKLMIKSGKSPLPIAPKRLLIVFQPHRYSRTKKFIQEFAKALSDADSLILAPIYGAGENPIEGCDSEVLAKKIKDINPTLLVKVASDFDHLISLIKRNSFKDDLVLTMGAGDINKVWGRLHLSHPNNPWLGSIAA